MFRGRALGRKSRTPVQSSYFSRTSKRPTEVSRCSFFSFPPPPHNIRPGCCMKMSCTTGPCLAVFVLVAFVVSPGCQAQERRVTVRTPLGQVSGRVVDVVNHTVHQFLGIPYAEAPFNELRFAKPIPVHPWTNTLDATELGFSCPQPGLDREVHEDCLFLNIYVPVLNDSVNSPEPKAVMVWIHGGGFYAGSGGITDGSLMAVRGDVVVVTINYRLGVLGWLSTLDQASPGNFGLWDQKMAIEFVRDNIAAFGGDPGQITIFGESAGGYSVGLHTLSPLNNGLFQRAVMQSGTALNPRAIAKDPVGFARHLAANLSCPLNPSNRLDNQYLIDCIRERSVEEILRATGAAKASVRHGGLAYLLDLAPVIDGDLIPADVRTLLGPSYRGRVPFWTIDVMVGTTNAEGNLVLSPLRPFQETLDFSLTDGIPTRVVCSNITTALARDYFRDSKEVSDEMCGRYTSGDGDGAQGRETVNLYGDMMFVAAAVETLKLHAAGSQRRHFQYLFSFSYLRESSGIQYEWFRGAGHGEEVVYVFGMSSHELINPTLSEAMLHGWTSFAKFGTPNDPQHPTNFQWPEYNLTNRAYTNLGQNVTSAGDLYSQRMELWLQTIPRIMNTDASSSLSSRPGSRVTSTEGVAGSQGADHSGNGAEHLLRFAGVWELSCCLLLIFLTRA